MSHISHHFHAILQFQFNYEKPTHALAHTDTHIDSIHTYARKQVLEARRVVVVVVRVVGVVRLFVLYDIVYTL